MPIDVYGRVGPGYATDGNSAEPRLTKDLGVVVQHLHSSYFEAVTRGQIFTASTGVAGVAPGTALSTTPPFTLYNPLGSGVNLVIVSASLGYISGTLGAGTVVYAVNNNIAQAAPTGGTTLTAINGLIGNASASKAKVFQGSTLATTPTILRDAFILPAFAGAAAAPSPPVRDIVDGAMVVMPGAALSLQAIAAAGTSPLALFSMTWEEVLV